MNFETIEKYIKLSKENPSLCFKFELKNKGEFILGIVSNKGPICFEVDKDLWEKVDVKKIYKSNNFRTYIKGNNYSLDNLELNNISYFYIEDGTLFYYFGNEEQVIIPKEVKTIFSKAFSYNNNIKSVKGDSVEEVYHYAFSENKNLEILEFKNAEIIHNLLHVPKLKKIIVGYPIKQIHIEDTLQSDFQFIVSHEGQNETYINDENLEDYFLNNLPVGKYNNKKLSLVLIDGNNKKFSIEKNDQYNQLISICKFENFYNKLPDFIKNILKNNNIVFYILQGLEKSGCYIDDYKTIIFDVHHIYKIVFYHEIGHALDYFLGMVSSCDEFRQIYAKEKNLLYSSPSIISSNYYLSHGYLEHVIEDEIEYFAECFNRYYIDPQNLLKECPKSYNFIETLVQKLDNEYNTNNSKNEKQLKLNKKI